jgi:hypothetical protein
MADRLYTSSESDEILSALRFETKLEKNERFIETAKDLQTEIARLEPWQVVSRSDIKTEEFTKFTAEAFYKNY